MYQVFALDGKTHRAVDTWNLTINGNLFNQRPPKPTRRWWPGVKGTTPRSNATRPRQRWPTRRIRAGRTPRCPPLGRSRRWPGTRSRMRPRPCPSPPTLPRLLDSLPERSCLACTDRAAVRTDASSRTTPHAEAEQAMYRRVFPHNTAYGGRAGHVPTRLPAQRHRIRGVAAPYHTLSPRTGAARRKRPDAGSWASSSGGLLAYGPVLDDEIGHREVPRVAQSACLHRIVEQLG